MSTAIAFLSGKGGSGKTTLALSMADLLCRCGMRILLVDCDLSTNGATYFYESQLYAWNKVQPFKVVSFDDILNVGSYMDGCMPLEIRPKLDFIPSIPEISGRHLVKGKALHSQDSDLNLSKFLNQARQNYDVILFDCQAGYTEILPVLLPLVDVDLFVLEADSISASAMRSLHLKVGNYLGNARLYQIFNKATPEEFEIYSKIVGTFFTNIGTLLFDWKIRQAFSRTQIPDLEHTSAKYGSDLCAICQIILSDKDSQKTLSRFSARLTYLQLEEKYRQTEDELYKLEVKPHPIQKSFFVNFLSIISMIVGICTVFLFFPNERLIFSEIDYETYTKIIMILLLVILVTFIVVLLLSVIPSQELRKTRKKYERDLRDLDKELEKLRRLLQENKKN